LVFAGDMIGGISIDFRLLFTVTAIAILGMLIGTQLSKKTRRRQTQTCFRLVRAAYGNLHHRQRNFPQITLCDKSHSLFVSGLLILRYNPN